MSKTVFRNYKIVENCKQNNAKASKAMAKKMKEFKKNKEHKMAIEKSRRVANQVRKEILNNKELTRHQM